MRETFGYQKNISPAICLVLFFAGILAGILFVQGQKDAVFSGIFSEYFLNQYASLKIDYERLLGYVGSCRGGQYALVICCGTLAMAPVIFAILLFGLGMTWGTMVSISTVRLGVKGVLICVMGILPQVFFYIPAFGWVLLWIWKKGNNRKRYWFLVLGGLFFLVFGIVTEVYINPLILQQILRKM